MRHFKTLLFATSVLLLAACDNASDSMSGTPGVTDSEIVFGSHSDLSGPVALWGVGSINAVRMRFDEVNDAGGIHGRKIRFVVEDTQYQVPRAIQAANKLINRDKVFALVLPLGTPMNNAVMTQQVKAGVPSIFPLTGARSMVEPFQELIFTQRGIYYDEIRAGVKYFLEAEGKRAPCVVYQDTDFGHEILVGAKDQLQAMGRKLMSTSTHRPAETEFTSSIIRLRNAGCDVVFMGTALKDTILIMETARKMNFNPTFVGNNAAYGQSIADHDASEGYYAFVHMAKIYKDDGLRGEVLDWWNRYEARFGEEPDLPAMEGLRGANLVVLALERAGPDLTRETFLKAIESINDYTDIFGYKIKFGPNDHKGVDESVLSVVRNGKWETSATSVSY